MSPFHDPHVRLCAQLTVMVTLSIGIMVGANTLVNMIIKANEMRSAASVAPASAPATVPAETPAEADHSGGHQVLIILGIVIAVLVILLLAWIGFKRVSRDITASRAQRRRIEGQRASQAAAWQTYVETYNKVRDQVLATEDWDTLFYKPALNDVSIPVIAQAWQQWDTTSRMDRSMPTDLDPDADISTLAWPKAVRALDRTWRQADEYARRIGHNRLPKEERKTIKTIRTLLRIAESDGASPSERQSAYQRIDRLARKLERAVVPAKARQQIETGAKTLHLIEA